MACRRDAGEGGDGARLRSFLIVAMSNPAKKPDSRDPVPGRILLVLGCVGGGLLAFYLVLAVQAWAWSPAVYVRYAESPRSRTLLDPAGPPVRPQATQPTPVEHGREVYRRAGCAVCHGVDGKGGVINPNYQRGTFPQLNNISQRLFLRDADSHAAALEALNEGIPLDADEDLGIDRQRLVGVQYANVVRIILDGNPAQRKDPAGVAPLPMPGWRDRLSETDVRDVIAYLISLQDLKVYEEEE
ncbi:MAG: cytochrome c [Verrucomicrobia bacterium]|nr:MAG: cytochrome c [Verrucomicrobiota bacterium]